MVAHTSNKADDNIANTKYHILCCLIVLVWGLFAFVWCCLFWLFVRLGFVCACLCLVSVACLIRVKQATPAREVLYAQRTAVSDNDWPSGSHVAIGVVVSVVVVLASVVVVATIAVPVSVVALVVVVVVVIALTGIVIALFAFVVVVVIVVVVVVVAVVAVVVVLVAAFFVFVVVVVSGLSCVFCCCCCLC
jgi:hypothetical protein